MSHVNAVSFTILVVAFLVVALVGFAAARWRRAESMLHLDEWGLGGRGFGTFVSWFLLGGDLYTAYTFIAVPALVFGVGAAGFFAVPYTIMVFPIVFVFAPRLWSVCRVHGYVTPADFVRGRYGSRGLALAIAVTGILATMPYIALQLVGIESVLTVLGVGSSAANSFLKDLPLLIAFLVLAAYTYLSGLRAPALTAFIKDTLVYVAIIVAVIYIPTRVGGWSHIFSTAATHLASTNPKTGKPFGALVTPPAGEWAYATLALGSALALFMYPHAITGVLATKRRDVIRRNMALLPAYSLILGLVALLGFMALASPAVTAGVKAADGNAQLAVPLRSRTSSRAGSPASATRRSSSARWSRPRSCRLPPPTCSPATSTGSSSPATPARPTRPGSPRASRSSSRRARWSSCSPSASRSPSTCSCSAASGSCRPSRPSWPACTPAGSTAGR
ncbi:MAG TPA: hypothetical protein VK586_04900 [Streptosporangiaceae bacterium]|nr:hypothetical protein [Streptosporangiaceae bacterium]